MPTVGSCPSCGAPLPFRPGTMVAVCRSCKSLSARTDRDPELIGKVADLVDTGSPLALGLSGKYAGRTFSLAGHVQLGHPLGGLWDEWYLAFDDGRWGWLAEAQGRFYLTFEAVLEAGAPPLESLSANQTLDFGTDGRWAVVERSEGTFRSGEGEIPWRVDPGRTYPFVDLSGPHGAFATLDYGDVPPAFYLGREVRQEDLGLPLGAAIPKKAKALSLNCPNCASPLTLRAPDQSLRVACPSCSGLLDCAGGKLRYLKSLDQGPSGILIPTGTEGLLHGVPYTCIGALRRSCTVEGTTYPWTEYLLLDARGGFRWLTESDGHWSLVDLVPAGEVAAAGVGGLGASHKGRTFRRFQDVVARVDAVFGEFTWKVAQGELAEITEYVAPPLSLSKEVQKHPGGGEEVNWSLSTYEDPHTIWTAFKLEGQPPSPRGIAPHMPNPHKTTLGRLSPWIVGGLAALLLMVMFASMRNREALLLKETVLLPVPAAGKPTRGAAVPKPANTSATPAPEAAEPVFFLGPIAIEDGTRNLAFDLAAPLEQSWLGLEGALVSEQTGEVELFETSVSWYHGVDDGESWSEGSRKERVLLSALPKGTYMLRLAPAWEGPRPPVPAFQVELRSGVMHWTYAWLTLLAILFWPMIQLFRVMGFEGRRWAESMYGQAGTSDSGGGD